MSSPNSRRLTNLRNVAPVNYGECNEAEEVLSNDSIAMNSEMVNPNDVTKSTESLNLVKQYQRIITNDKRNDMEVDLKRLIPKHCNKEDSHYLYVEFHPGVYHLVINHLP